MSDGMVRLHNRGYNLNNVDTWKWDKSSGYLWIYFTGSAQPVQVDGGEAKILHAFLEHTFSDVVKWNELD